MAAADAGAGAGDGGKAAVTAATRAVLEPERDREREREGPVTVCLGERGTAKDWANASVADPPVEMPPGTGVGDLGDATAMGDRNTLPDADRDKLVGERWVLLLLIFLVSAREDCPSVVLVGWLPLNDGRRECDG